MIAARAAYSIIGAFAILAMAFAYGRKYERDLVAADVAAVQAANERLAADFARKAEAYHAEKLRLEQVAADLEAQADVDASAGDIALPARAVERVNRR